MKSKKQLHFEEFMESQAKEIKKYKWIESEKAHHDLGNECCLEWVKKFSKKYREYYYNKMGWKE